MKNIHNDFEELKHSLKIQTYCFVALIVLSVTCSFTTYRLGYIRSQKQIIKNAKSVSYPQQSTYSSDEVETIIFGEPQT